MFTVGQEVSTQTNGRGVVVSVSEEGIKPVKVEFSRFGEKYEVLFTADGKNDPSNNFRKLYARS